MRLTARRLRVRAKCFEAIARHALLGISLGIQSTVLAYKELGLPECGCESSEVSGKACSLRRTTAKRGHFQTVFGVFLIFGQILSQLKGYEILMAEEFYVGYVLSFGNKKRLW